MGSLANINSPPSTALFHAPIAVSLGEYHSCIVELDPDGHQGVRCWGSNHQGQLGVDATGGEAIYAHGLNDEYTNLVLLDVQSVYCGGYHTCALMAPGGFRCWGSNAFGQLGTGGSLSPSVYSPPTADAMTGAVSVAVGEQFACVLQGIAQSGNLTCFGNASFGQNGVDFYSNYAEYEPHSAAISTPALTNVTAFGVGSTHVCGYSLAPGKTGLLCWGGNTHGEWTAVGAFVL